MNYKIFSRRVRRCLAVLREAGKRGGKSEAFVWLADNHYLLESEGRAFLRNVRDLRNLPDGGERVISMADSFVSRCRAVVTEEALDSFLGSHPLCDSITSAEFGYLGLCITGALLIRAQEALSSGGEDGAPLMAAVITSLRQSDGLDMSSVLSRHCFAARELEKDPGDFYRLADDESKAELRRRVAAAAKKSGMSETEYISRLRAKAGDGSVFPFIPPRSGRLPAAARGIFLAVVPAALSLLCALAAGMPWAALVLWLPWYALLLPAADTVTLRFIRPSRLLRFDPERGIPAGGETAVVISCLLTDPACVRSCFRRLESFSLANPDTRLRFGLLADFPDAAEPSLPTDRAVIKAALSELSRLEKAAPGRFFLFLRGREYSETQRSYSGKERKRGALLDIMRFSRGEKPAGLLFRGDEAALRRCAYVLTLDSDTDLPTDCAAELVCVAMHPENRPEIRDGRVVKGHGVFAPRIGTSLSAWQQTGFSRAMSGSGGASPYTGAVGDIYQDLFGSGLFSGKGLIDIDAALSLLPSALPDNRILSHDIPEGCILRAAFVSDIEMTDGCPSRAAGWFKRLHRWTRGDVQNVLLLFSSRFDLLSKLKLADNLRRAVTLPVTLAAMCFIPFLSTGTALYFLAVCLISMAPGEYLTVALRFFRRLFSPVRYSGASPARAAAARAFILTVTAAETGILLADASLRALWRLTVTKRGLLEWSTAAQGDKGGLCCVRGSLFAAALTAVTLLFPGANLLILPPALLWLLAPAAVKAWDRPFTPSEKKASARSRRSLENFAAAMWRFFEDLLTPERGMLPPDNIQLDPVGDAAERTSPTNIGLMLLSAAAARDLELISTREMTDILSSALNTCVSLKKYKGNLYNWYDLRDMSVLAPGYLSSVDSGNFLCCLIALRQAILHYRGEDVRLWELYGTVSQMIDETDLSIFADLKRGRLLTGIDGDGAKSSSAYDLLMSEALLTVYCGVALGKLPKKIFLRLGRLCGRAGNFTGALSWTGTMFEYFMPTLLLPVFHGSFIESSLKFALRCQKERVKARGLPWGISESAYYGFDQSLHYRYRAHGVQKAALCRGQDADLVISPYSSFLTLCMDPDGAVKNLARLKERGMWGKYGFFEALDLTPSRCGENGAVVKSFMAHHVGMSMVACANALLDGIFVKRFMSDPAMSAAAELLKERLPDAAPVYRGFDDRREERPPRIVLPQREFDAVSPVSPRVSAMSGGGLSMVLSDCGAGFLSMGDTDITSRSDDLISLPKGLFCFISSGGNTFSMSCAPDYSPMPGSGSRQVKFSPGETVYYAHADGLDAALSLSLCGDSPAGGVRFTVKNLTGRRRSLKALLYFEPMLCPHGDAAAHRAFAKLFLSVKKHPDGAVFSRRPGRGAPPLSLAVCRDVSAGVSRLFDRTKVLSRPLGEASLASAFSAGFEPVSDKVSEEFFTDVCGAVRLSVSLPPYGQKSVTWYFDVNEDRDAAMEAAREMCRKGYRFAVSSAAAAAADRAALAGADEMCSAVEGQILPCLIFPHRFSPECRDALTRLRKKGDDTLWSMSISGDIPIILAELGGSGDVQRVRTFLRIHRHLSLSGVKCDLVFTCRDRHEYSRPVSSAVKSEINALGLEWCLNRKGGVFVVDLTDREDAEDFLRARAAYTAPRVMLRVMPPAAPFLRVPALPVSPGPVDESDPTGSFIVDPQLCRPARPWCHILANGCFGTLVSDRSIGHTYAFSSRDNRISPWSNDPCLDLNGESLLLDAGGKRFSLTDGAKAVFAPEYALWSGHIPAEGANISSRVRASLCGRLPVKRTDVSLSCVKSCDFRLTFMCLPAADGGKPPLVRYFEDNGVLVWENMSAMLYTGYFFLFAVSESPGVSLTLSCDRESLLSGRQPAPAPACGAYSCAAALWEGSLGKGGDVSVSFYLGYSGTLSGVCAMVSLLRGNGNGRLLPVSPRDAVRISSRDAGLDRLVNTFLPHQISACRILARTAFWQSSGARGFRDQLQDACAQVIYDPVSAKRQIIRAACRQFERGDVLHWWNDRGPRPPAGSRTRCSDDLLWLPYSVHRYIDVTGDLSLLDAVTPYIDGETPGESGEKYVVCSYSGKKNTVYEHCLLAVRRAFVTGSHGLVLMGSCDWNDGLSAVGVKGKGETVWGTMFLSLVCRHFSGICFLKGDTAAQSELLSYADRLDEAWKKQFSKDRYVRAYDDSGAPLGVEGNRSMSIDVLPQSFAAILCPGEKEPLTALDTAVRLLADEKAGVIRLFTPPFDSSAPPAVPGGPADDASVGYIAAYPPGVRENGGQYTHAAVWLLFALAANGRTEDAWRLCRMISPSYAHESRGAGYGGEPYYLAADLKGSGPDTGKAGWTMYTGAAGWYYRLIVEELYGIRRRGDCLFIEPCLPAREDGFCCEAEFTSFDGKKTRVFLKVVRTGRDFMTVSDSGMPSCPGENGKRSGKGGGETGGFSPSPARNSAAGGLGEQKAAGRERAESRADSAAAKKIGESAENPASAKNPETEQSEAGTATAKRFVPLCGGDVYVLREII